ncbi:hypothetical protein M2B17_03195, partial [Klebsiella pneumoniae]|nr:hypothetical protein [Klebsiella pneumoniae]
QEGQQTETEATGAPQKHHYTLNQQVGSITIILCNKSHSFALISIILTSSGPIKIPMAMYIDIIKLTKSELAKAELTKIFLPN